MRGHRTVPHTADTRIEAWAPTMAECVSEAVRGMVAGFLDPREVAPAGERELRVAPADPADQLVSVLDEIIYLMDTTGQVPVTVRARQNGGDLVVSLGMADLAEVPQIGAVPKAVSLHQLALEKRADQWVCAVTLDV